MNAQHELPDIPRWCDLTETQRRVVEHLAKAELADPPAWVVMSLSIKTVRKLTNFDLIVVSDDMPRRAHITRRGLLYYRERLAVPPAHFDDEALRQMIEACAAGQTYRAVAMRFGCSVSYVGLVVRGRFPAARRVLESMGQAPRPVVRPAHDDAKREQVLAMRREGARYADIHAATGIPYGTMGKWFREAGLRTEGWLPDEERREIVRLVCEEGLSYTEVAARIGRSMRPVKDTMAAYYSGQMAHRHPAAKS